jgi:hypothetical protein
MVIMVLGGCASASTDGGGVNPGEDSGTNTDDAGADGSITIDAAPDAVPIDAAPMLATITQSTSQAIASPSTVACWNQNVTRENHFYRVFPLTDHGITGPFQVQNVQFGVEVSLGGHTVTVNVGTYGGPYAPGAAGLDSAQFAPIASASVSIPDGNAFMVTAPIALTIPAGGKMMVEIVSPNVNDRFFPGSNGSGETYSSFFRSPQCDNSIKSYAASGFPAVHLVMNVTGLH